MFSIGVACSCFNLLISCSYGELEGHWDPSVEFTRLRFITERVSGLAASLPPSAMLLFKSISPRSWSIEGLKGDWELSIVDLVAAGDLTWLTEVTGISPKYEVELKSISPRRWSSCVSSFAVVACVLRGDTFAEGNITPDLLGKPPKLWPKEIKLLFSCPSIEGQLRNRFISWEFPRSKRTEREEPSPCKFSFLIKGESKLTLLCPLLRSLAGKGDTFLPLSNWPSVLVEYVKSGWDLRPSEDSAVEPLAALDTFLPL